MTFKLKRKRIDTSTEKRILTGMIVSKEYLQEIHSLIDISYFQSSFSKTVVNWILDFYDAYGEVPLKNIQDIFNEKKEKMEEEESKIIAKLLTDISQKHEADGVTNVPYLVDQTEQYFKRRELEITSDNLKLLLNEGDIEGAEIQIEKFRKVQKLTSNWVNPFDDGVINETFAHMDEVFFMFPGQLGTFMKNLEREWLIGIAGPFKRGKTFFAIECAIIGIITGLRVVFFSLEMPARQINKRIYRRLTAFGDIEGSYRYPMFDCELNQTGECENPNRTNSIQLVDDDGELPPYDPESNYNVCTHCREIKDGEYLPATWFEMIKRPEFSVHEVGNKLKAFQKRFKNLLRVKAYPKFTANIADMMRDLDVLEHTEGYIPDLIIVDHADIVKGEVDHSTGVDKEDRTWIALAQMAGIRKALVFAPTQVTKEAMDVRQVTSKHTARWVGKLGHVDGMLALNQTPEEKEMGVMRISWMVHRHEDYFEEANCIILQNLALGQVNLDSQREVRRNE